MRGWVEQPASSMQLSAEQPMAVPRHTDVLGFYCCAAPTTSCSAVQNPLRGTLPHCSTTYRLENTLNYGMERVWAVGYVKGTNSIAVGCAH
jgi:hypothetical protein